MMLNRRTAQARKRAFLVALSVLVVVFVAIAGFAPPHIFKTLAVGIARPFWQSRLSVSNETASVWDAFVSKTELARENQELRDALRDAELRLRDRTLLREENRNLKALLGRIEEGEYILASVLVRPGETPYDTFIIDAGDREGVTLGGRVFGSELYVVGTVAEVFPHSARVTLFSTPGVETNVFFPHNDAVGTARGEGGGNFLARLPGEISFRVGDSVTLPGVDEAIVGFVGTVEQSPGDVFQTVRFRTPINLSTAQEVLVEK